MTSTNLEHLAASEYAQALYALDHVGDPIRALEDLSEAVRDYVEPRGLDSLPEELCGPTSGLFAAAMLAATVADEGNVPDVITVVRLRMVAEAIDHSAEHGNPLGVSMRWQQTPMESLQAAHEFYAAILAAEEDLVTVFGPEDEDGCNDAA